MKIIDTCNKVTSCNVLFLIIEKEKNGKISPFKTAKTLLKPGSVTPLRVTEGQIIEFEYENEKTLIENGILEIESPEIILDITATDASGNTATAQAQPQGLAADNDDEILDPMDD